MSIVSLESMGNAHAREIIVAADELGKTDEKLNNAKRAHDEKQALVYITQELHYIERIESFLNGKTLALVEELRQMQGRITAKKVTLHTQYKQLKIERKNTEEQERLGKEIRELDELIREIQKTDEEIISGSKRDISTLRLIMQRAGKRLDIFGWFK